MKVHTKSQFTVLSICLLTWVTGRAQTISFCDDLKPDTSACAAVLASVLNYRNNKIYYKNILIEVCSLHGGFNLFLGQDEKYRFSGVQIVCDYMTPKKPFNNKFDGLKQGVWFAYSFTGRVKRVTEYNSGRIAFVIDFWPNGLTRHIIKYKPDGKPVEGSDRYYRRLHN